MHCGCLHPIISRLKNGHLWFFQTTSWYLEVPVAFRVFPVKMVSLFPVSSPAYPVEKVSPFRRPATTAELICDPRSIYSTSSFKFRIVLDGVFSSFITCLKTSVLCWKQFQILVCPSNFSHPTPPIWFLPSDSSHLTPPIRLLPSDFSYLTPPTTPPIWFLPSDSSHPTPPIRLLPSDSSHLTSPTRFLPSDSSHPTPPICLLPSDFFHLTRMLLNFFFKR